VPVRIEEYYARGAVIRPVNPECNGGQAKVAGGQHKMPTLLTDVWSLVAQHLSLRDAAMLTSEKAFSILRCADCLWCLCLPVLCSFYSIFRR